MTHRGFQVISDTFFYSAGLMLRRGIAIVTLPVFTRYLTLREFGILSIVGTVRELLIVAFQFGIPNAADRFYYDCSSERDRRRLFGSLFLFMMPTSLVASLLLLAVGPEVWPRLVEDVPFHPFISLTIVTVFLAGMGMLPRSLFRVTNRVPLFASLALAHGLVAAGLSVVLVVVWGLGVLGSVVGNLGASALFFSCSSGTSRGTWRGTSLRDWSSDRWPSGSPTFLCVLRHGR